jgi:hypothetical protein
MFKNNDEKYIKRLIQRNEVILFLGAGFSLDAKNKLNENFPKGWELGKKIWNFLGYEGEYDDTSLSEMYQVFLDSGKRSKIDKVDFLENNLLTSSIPEIYDGVAEPYWYKIYTLNVDDLLDKVYRAKNKNIDVLKYPKDEFKERDQSLFKTQIVHLNGKLPCSPDELIFSYKQYTKAALKEQRLYAQFVFEYATKPVIFIGTDLNEPLFEKYIEAREGKQGYSESRPKSFLITPSLSQIKKENLKNLYNIVHIKGKTSDFLNWIKSIVHELPERNEILKNTFPNFIDISSYSKVSNTKRESIKEFSEAFNRIPSDYVLKGGRSLFLLGATPKWEDIFQERDVDRTSTDELFDYVNEKLSSENELNVLSLTGTAGSGKSTILKRLGLRLSQSGVTTFLSYSDCFPKFRHITNVVENIKGRVVLIFDNAENVLSFLPNLLKELNKLEETPIIILSTRPNHLNNLTTKLEPILKLKKFVISDLNDEEIYSLIGKLKKENLLGKLNGKTKSQQYNAFRYVAKKQILIALKEATSGLKFNEIIKNEFEEIGNVEAKTLCLCVALSTQLGYTNSKQDFVGFTKGTYAEALHHLNNTLRGTIITAGPTENKIMLRHRILADYIIKYCANLEMLKDAYIRVLSVLAPELKISQGYSRKFNLYRSLINHRSLYKLFKNNIEHARFIYDSVSPFFDDDAQFWLQYSSLEIEGREGDLDLAENYLSQAESLSPTSYYIQTAKCNLLYKKSEIQTEFNDAFQYKEEADLIANDLILSDGSEDPYIFHIYSRGVYNYIKNWVMTKEIKAKMLKELLNRIKTGINLHPSNERLETIYNSVNRAYLNLGIANDIEDPEIPLF